MTSSPHAGAPASPGNPANPPSAFASEAAARAKHLLWGIAALIASEGMVHGWASGVGGQVPPRMDLAYSICQAVLVYLWLRSDAHARGASRSASLSGWVIAVAVIGVPIYLWRSRASGQRLKALCRFALYVLLLAAAYLLAGAPVAYWLGGV